MIILMIKLSTHTRGGRLKKKKPIKISSIFCRKLALKMKSMLKLFTYFPISIGF